MLLLRSLFKKQFLNSATKLTRSVSSSPSAAGISFQVSDDQKSFLDLAEKFSKEEIVPKAAQYDSMQFFSSFFLVLI